LQRWIVVPGCRVEAIVDGDAPKIVGFGSVAEALEDWMRERGLPIGEEDGRYKVQSTTCDGVTIAMGLAWSERYQEWTFVEAGRMRDYDTGPLGMCVEGIRVERDSPGFRGHVIAAIADARGARAPRTDVARSELEVTEELTAALRKIYGTYAAHVRREVDALMGSRGYSLDWTAEEARMLLAPLIRRKAVEEDLLTEVLSEVPTIVLDDGTRRLASVKELGAITRFWTIHSALFDSMRSLFREVSTTASAAGIIRALGVTGVKFPNEPVIDASWTDVNQREAFRGRDVALVVLQTDQRRVDFAWEWYESAPRWWSFRPDVRGYPELVEVLERGRFRAIGMPQVLDNCMVAGSAVAISGRTKEAGVRIGQNVYLFPGTAVAEYLERLRARFDAEDTRDARAVQVVVFQALGRLLTSVRRVTASDVAELIERTMFVDSELRLRDTVPRFMDVSEFVHAVTSEPILMFDPHGWRRVDDDDDDYEYGYEYDYEYDYEP
jgi:molecular chaperone HtpG